MATVHNPLDDILCILRNEDTGLAARIVNSRVRPGTYATPQHTITHSALENIRDCFYNRPRG